MTYIKKIVIFLSISRKWNYEYRYIYICIMHISKSYMLILYDFTLFISLVCKLIIFQFHSIQNRLVHIIMYIETT